MIDETHTPAFNSELAEKINKAGIIAVLVIDNADDAVPLAKTLLDNGISVMELTLRTSAALEALRRIRNEVPEMIAGAGTVLTPEQVDAVFEAGAEFAVAPGLNRNIIARAKQLGISFAPGVMTPSDIEAAIEMGCKIQKFFPAETTGGLKHLSSMAAPYKHLGISFIPLGGLTAQNMKTYIESPLVSAIGGSWIAKQNVIAANDWDTIAKNASEAAAIVKSVRG